MAGKHAAQHHEIGTGAESLGNVARGSTAAIRHDVAAKSVRRVGAIGDGGELRIADARHLASRADRAGANSHFYDVGPGQHQCLCHLACRDVAGDDYELRERFSRARDELDELLAVAVGDIQTRHLQLAADGELVEQDGRQFKSFYGMSSRKAMETYFGEVAKHRAPEGKEVRVPYRGPIEPTLQAILGGLRSACSYVGAWRIKDLPKCTTFVRVTRTTNDVYKSFDVDD